MGMLIPRMTMAERDAIVSPATGLILFQTDNTGGFYYNSGTPEAPLWMPVGSTSGWGTTGNGGLTTGINFLGTTDDVPLMFKVNNQLAGKIESFNTALGLNAMYANTTGSGNIAVGTGALYNNTVRGSLVAIGDSAMYGNLSGLQNTAIGSKGE